MNSERLPKILLTGFLSALVLYIITFALLQSCRTTKGPWRVVFLTDNAGTPGLLVTQPKLKISKRIMFSNEKFPQSNTVRAVVFDDPTKTNVPFGKVIFQDLTFLPGTVTLDMFGHELEFLPRVLTVDKHEYAWKDKEAVLVRGEGTAKPPEKKK
jgi:hypothetical protein